MVDKKTGLKPKKVVSSKRQAVSKGKAVTKKGDTEPKSAKLEQPKPETLVEEEYAKISVKSSETVDEQTTTKAGKHSAKAVREAKAEQERQDRKKTHETEETKPKITQKPPRSRAERAGKKYREAAKLIDKNKSYSLNEALDLAVKTATTKFDSTVEMHINLDVDPTQADQNVRDSLSLPAGTGKTTRIAVFVEADGAAKAKAAGADVVGENDLLANLDKEKINFDVLITNPNLMPRLGKYAKLLGPKGLMPNPKSGTITTDIAKAVAEAKAGKVEYRVDPAGIIHIGIGKASFGADKLNQNAEAIMASVRAAKPASLKGNYINSIYVTSSMGPSIKIAI